MDWQGFHREKPWRTWFWADDGPIYIPDGDYMFYKIPPEGIHDEQRAFKSPVTRKKTVWYEITVYADRIYVLTEEDDSPNWGGIADLVAISPPCSNWESNVYYFTHTVRSQTSGLNAYVRAQISKTINILATIAKTDQMADAITASVQGQPEEQIGIQSAVKGEVTLNNPVIKTSIAKEMEFAPGIEAAVSGDVNLNPSICAWAVGNPKLDIRYRAAVSGQAEKRVGITAHVVVSRVEQIYLEMENLVPQELALTSTPNWASRVKDWRKEKLGS